MREIRQNDSGFNWRDEKLMSSENKKKDRKSAATIKQSHYAKCNVIPSCGNSNERFLSSCDKIKRTVKVTLDFTIH